MTRAISSTFLYASSHRNCRVICNLILAESEKIVIDDSTDSTQSPTLQFNKSKGIKKILGKMKRSGSGNLDELPGIGDFQRGGVRATAAARLGWSEPQLTPKYRFFYRKLNCVTINIISDLINRSRSGTQKTYVIGCKI